jgi:hypothetical protein
MGSRPDQRSRWQRFAAVVVVTSALGLNACGSDGETVRTERTSTLPAATTAPTTATRAATTVTSATTHPATQAPSPTPPAAPRSAAVTVQWGETDRLTIDGSGFQPTERVAVTLVVQSQQASGGSSQTASQQSTVTISADAQGALRLETTVSAPTGAAVRVTAAGDRGSSADVSMDVPRR